MGSCSESALFKFTCQVTAVLEAQALKVSLHEGRVDCVQRALLWERYCASPKMPLQPLIDNK
eukprot:945034-Amphidinium_carterae.1